MVWKVKRVVTFGGCDLEGSEGDAGVLVMNGLFFYLGAGYMGVLVF